MREPTMAEVFRAAGYRTALIGKWHIEPDPHLLGFDYAVYPHYSHRYAGQTFHEADGGQRVVEGFGADYEMDLLRSYLGQRRDEPFFLYYNISQPHMPLAGMPETYRTMYPRDSVPLRENVYQDGRMAHDERWFRIYLWDYLFYREHLPYTEKSLGDFDLRDLTALYYGAGTWADDQLGELIRCLDENGLTEDTLVVFTSDHGDNLGSRHLFNKDVLYEEAIRIPLIFHWLRGLRSGVVETQVASLLDVMPTVLSLSGIETPPTAQGTELSPVLRREEEFLGENAAFIETSKGDIGIRTLACLYGVLRAVARDGASGDPGDEMLYDITADPLQQRNLAEESQAADKLKDRLGLWNLGTPWLPSR
jgi:choline-sulfatase